ncbi:putative PhzF superfamily epimerase YddE/YHI9 [Streptomyces sp. TLI_235]|nr:PhzF family phenazine biosynthesis protein [Streptomyces sp. TLI_235]PBC70251.1 putative PhzF superfamily epimerase YddE/YHI9 [Streptomyces sp. TLI_235]
MPDATVAIVRACLREGRGGSPTAVLDEADLGEADLSDDARRTVPARTGTSHAVYVSAADGGPAGPEVSLRFFTAAGELPACGHGTVAALAFLAERAGVQEFRAPVRTPGRVFTGHAVRTGGRYSATFDPGPVDVREPAADEHAAVLDALGLTPDTLTPDTLTPDTLTADTLTADTLTADTLAPGARIAALGRPRLLVPVPSRTVLAALTPDFDRLRAACDRLGLLGCYVHCVPTAEGRLAARMFAPSIGVPEDIANVNSTACLAAHLARTGVTDLTVDMGDTLGMPATITAAAQPGPHGPLIHIGGAATTARIVRPA